MSDIVNYALRKSFVSELIKEESLSGLFNDHAPIVMLLGGIKTKLKFSENPDKEVIADIKISENDYNNILKSKKLLQSYTFILESSGEEKTIILSGKEINEGGSAILYVNKPYTIIEDTDTGKEETQSTENSYRGKDIEDVNGLLKDLKTETNDYKVIQQYKEDPEFRKIFLDSFIDSTKSIKMNDEKIGATLKKMRSAGLLEEPGMSGLKRKYLKLKLNLQKFFNNLFKLFAKLHKDGKESKLYKQIKQFYKDLFFIVRQGASNISDEKTRNILWKKLIGSFGNLLSSLNKSNEFVKSKYKGKPKNEAIIKEVEDKRTVMFLEFDVTDEDIENNLTDFAEENDIDNEESNNSDLDPDLIKRYGFMLYGKDTGRIFPMLSLKFRDIKNLIGLGKGGIEKKTDKMKEKYGLYGDVSSDSDVSMKNTPKYQLEFIDNINFTDSESGTKIRINSGEKLIFNYMENTKTLVHKQSAQKYGNYSIVEIGEITNPKDGVEYSKKITKIIPLKGGTFELKQNIPVKFKLSEYQK